MVSRDTRRTVALTGNRPYRSARVTIRRSVMPDDEAAPDDVDAVEETGGDDHDVEVARVRPSRTAGTRRRSSRRTRARLVGWVSTAVAVLALLTAAVQGWQWNEQRQLDTARQQALAAARQTTVGFVTISAATVDRDLQRVVAGATGDFKDEFTRAMPQVRAAVVENKVDSRGTVLRAAVVSADRGSAVVLVAVDATVRNVNAPTGRLAHYRIRVNLSLVGGAWLVSTLDFVG